METTVKDNAIVICMLLVPTYFPERSVIFLNQPLILSTFF